MILNVKGKITKLCGGGGERIVSGQILGRD